MNLNAELQSLSEGDGSLCNIAYCIGPGEGIQAMQLVLRDEASIAEYGDYPRTVTFGDAVSLSDLEAKGHEYLAKHSNPLQGLSLRATFEAGYDPLIECGDTITYASLEAGINVTERIVELAYDPDGVTFALKAPAADLAGAILDKQDEADRAARQLGLPAPVGFTLTSARPGVRLKFNPYVGSRAQGVEIHAALTPLFEPDAGTLVKRTADTEVHLQSVRHLPLGTRWYLKVAAYAGAERGEFTEELSALAGYITTEVLDPSIEEKLDQNAADERIQELRGELQDTRYYQGGNIDAYTSITLTDTSPFFADYAALGVQPGWVLRFTSGVLKYQMRTIIKVEGNTLTVDPPLPNLSGIVGSSYEIAANGRITALGQTSIVVELNKTPDQTAFSAIKQLSDEIVLAVARDAEQYAQFALLEDELDLRVVKGDMIAAINLDPTGVRISANRIQLNGDTAVNGNLDLTGGVSGTGHRVRVRDTGSNEKVALGYLQGRPWGVGALPANTWGLWGEGAGLWLRGVPKIVSSGDFAFTFSGVSVGGFGTEILSRNINFDGTTDANLNIPALSLIAGENLIISLAVAQVGINGDGLLPAYSAIHQARVNGGSYRNWQNAAEVTADTVINAIRAACSMTVYNPNSTSRTIGGSMRFSFQIYRVG